MKDTDSSSTASRRLIEAGFWLMVAVVPLVWTDGLAAEYTLPKLLVLSIGVFAASAGAVWASASGNRPMRPAAVDLPLWVAGGVLAASTALSRDRLLSVFGHYNAYVHGLWPLALLAASCWLAAHTLRGKTVERVLFVALVAGAIVGAYALLQSIGVDPFPRVGALPEGRAISTVGSPVMLGAYLAMLTPPALHTALEAGPRRKSGVVCFVLIAAGLAATVSRGSALAALIGCGVYLAFSRRWRLPRLSPAWLAAGLLAAATAGVLAVRLSARDIRFYDRPRVEIWRTAWRAFAEQPLFGSGPDTFEQDFRRLRSEAFIRARGPIEYQIDAHNDILQALATTGIAGLGAYLLLLAAAAASAWKRTRGRQPDRRAAALAAGLSALFINIKFNPLPLAAAVPAAVFLGTLCAAEDSSRSAGSRHWLPALMLAFAGVSIFLSLRLCRADRYFKLGLAFEKHGPVSAALGLFDSATRFNRCELEYRRKIVNHLIERAYAGAEGGGRERLELFDRAARYARAAMGCHPGDMSGRYIYGVASLMQAQAGRRERLAAAEKALDAALGLDPSSWPLLRTRLRAARLRGDLPTVEAMEARLRRIEEVYARPGNFQDYANSFFSGRREGTRPLGP